MQSMDVDEDVLDFLPSVLRKCMIYHSRVYTSAQNYSDFIITGGRNPVLYEVNGKHIQSSLHLNETAFTDITLGDTDSRSDVLNVSLNVHYSYKKKVKEAFIFLRLDNQLAILGQVDHQFVVYRKFNRINEYRITDASCSGEPFVEIVYQNGSRDEFELSSINAIKGIDARCISSGNERLDKISRELNDRVSLTSSNLAELRVKVQKEIHDFQNYCQSIDSNANEDNNILVRYGDYWIRNINNHLIIGIPIYNNSLNKHLVENVRAFVFCSDRSQVIYTQKLYGFETENASIDPTKLQEVQEQDDEKQTDLTYSQEWLHQKQYVIYPESAAVIVIKMDLKDIEMNANGSKFDFFLTYNVLVGSGHWKSFHTHVASIALDSDIFQDRRYAVTFDSHNLFRDLLASASTSKRLFYRLKFEDDALITQMHDVLTKRLCFDTILTGLHFEDNFRSFLSQNLDHTASANQSDEDHQMFYCKQIGYWNGTLIRMRTISAANSAEVYEMKIYSSSETTMRNLVTSLCNEFGRKICVEPLHCFNRPSLEIELKYLFRAEFNALEEFSKHLKYKTDKVQSTYNDFIDAQHRTDSIWADLIKDHSGPQ